jgi:hypothetical protein
VNHTATEDILARDDNSALEEKCFLSNDYGRSNLPTEGNLWENAGEIKKEIGMIGIQQVYQ